jgi:hypothetical protein
VHVGLAYQPNITPHPLPCRYFHKGSLAYVGGDQAVMDIPTVGPIFGREAGVMWKGYETFAQVRRCIDTASGQLQLLLLWLQPCGDALVHDRQQGCARSAISRVELLSLWCSVGWPGQLALQHSPSPVQEICLLSYQFACVCADHLETLCIAPCRSVYVTSCWWPMTGKCCVPVIFGV